MSATAQVGRPPAQAQCRFGSPQGLHLSPLPSRLEVMQDPTFVPQNALTFEIVPPSLHLPCALGSLIHLTRLFDLLLSSSAIYKTPPSARSPKNALQRPEQLPRPSTATARSTAELRSTNRQLPLPTRLARPTRQGSSASLSKDRQRTLDCLRRNLCWRRGRIRPTSAIGC